MVRSNYGVTEHNAKPNLPAMIALRKNIVKLGLDIILALHPAFHAGVKPGATVPGMRKSTRRISTFRNGAGGSARFERYRCNDAAQMHSRLLQSANHPYLVNLGSLFGV